MPTVHTTYIIQTIRPFVSHTFFMVYFLFFIFFCFVFLLFSFIVCLYAMRVDAEPVLCLLSVKINRIRRYHILRAEEKEVTTNLVASVPSFVDAIGSMDFSQILIRYSIRQQYSLIPFMRALKLSFIFPFHSQVVMQRSRIF